MANCEMRDSLTPYVVERVGGRAYLLNFVTDAKYFVDDDTPHHVAFLKSKRNKMNTETCLSAMGV